MRSRITQSSWLLLTPFVWAAIGIFWIFSFVILLVVLVAPHSWMYSYDTDPDPPGIEEDGPETGRLSHYGIV